MALTFQVPMQYCFLQHWTLLPSPVTSTTGHCFRFGSMSGSNCCFLTCVQISQESGKVVWYSHILKNFPQFVVIHTVKSFGTDNEADVFLEFPCFLYDLTDVGNLISGFCAFSKSSLYIWRYMEC